MALVSSGQLSIGSIATEKGSFQSNASLASLSSNGINQLSVLKPDGTAPHSISEFYGYNHTTSPPASYTAFSMRNIPYDNAFDACVGGPSNFGNITLYHNGTNETPGFGDTVFMDSGGTAFSLESFIFYFVYGIGGPNYSVEFNGSGVVQDTIFNCVAPK